MTDPTPTQAQRNHEAYKEKYRVALERDHFGRVALMHDGEVINIYNNMGDAYSIGYERYGLGNFSLKKIGARPVHLGILTAALP